MQIELISIEVTNQCLKECWFCYNHSRSNGETFWRPEELIAFIQDCIQHGIKAVSFGGGEPLQYPHIFSVLKTLQGQVFRSLTTNGLLLQAHLLENLIATKPDKVHISIHFPEQENEVKRVVQQVKQLEKSSIRSGINFLVSRKKLTEAKRAVQYIREQGISADRIVYLPMRKEDSPTPKEMAEVIGSSHFQSMTCLLQCGKSPRFCSVSWDQQVAWCSYTQTRHPLSSLTYQGLIETLEPLELAFCGKTSTSN